MSHTIEELKVERIFLYEQNPRHEPLGSEDEVIEYLCRDEQVLELAEHIAREGTNPLELIGVVELPGSGKRGTEPTYEVWEGNRRICAIKLLNDPERAPSKWRPHFQKLADRYTQIEVLNGVVFSDHARLKFWMNNIHAGQQGGVGRKRWDTRQQARHTGSKKDAIGLAVLNLAEGLGIISPEKSKRRLTTVTRYVEKVPMREALGLHVDDLDNIRTDLPPEDFKLIMRTFFDDLLAEKIGSRDNLKEIRPYARKLPFKAGVSGERVDPHSIQEIAGSAARRAKPTTPPASKARRPKAHEKLIVSAELMAALEASGNDKLSRLYYSICDVSVVHHTQLVAVGTWAFIETLTAHAGRLDVPFTSFYSNEAMARFGVSDKDEKKVMRSALSRLSEGGNTTKHHKKAAVYNGGQLVNDMEVVTPLLVSTLQSVSDKAAE